MGKHFDNKNDLLRVIRKQQMDNDMVLAAAHTAYMRMALLTLSEDFGFGTQRCERFNDGMLKRLNALDKGELTGAEMKERIFKRLGVYVEDPALPDWVTDRMLR